MASAIPGCELYSPNFTAQDIIRHLFFSSVCVQLRYLFGWSLWQVTEIRKVEDIVSSTVYKIAPKIEQNYEDASLTNLISTLPHCKEYNGHK